MPKHDGKSSKKTVKNMSQPSTTCIIMMSTGTLRIEDLFLYFIMISSAKAWSILAVNVILNRCPGSRQLVVSETFSQDGKDASVSFDLSGEIWGKINEFAIRNSKTFTFQLEHHGNETGIQKFQSTGNCIVDFN